MIEMIRPYTEDRFNYQLRKAAFSAWQAAIPTDPELDRRLISELQQGNYGLKKFSIELLGEMRSNSALPILRSIIINSGDPGLQASAQTAVERILKGKEEHK